jgi:hypothetical protein
LPDFLPLGLNLFWVITFQYVSTPKASLVIIPNIWLTL